MASRSRLNFSFGPFFRSPLAKSASMTIVNFPPDLRTVSMIFKICHVANVTSNPSIESGDLVQLSQCPQRSNAPASSVVHEEIESCEEWEKYLGTSSQFFFNNDC